jgi:DNA-directed RNA polymerase specialized sigma subunit
MWEAYRDIIRRYPRIVLSEERELISRAQNGSKKSKDELIFRNIGFLMFRIRSKVFSCHMRRFGEDLLEEAILITYNKIDGYDLDYHNKRGEPHPVRFVSYIWKRIDGFIIDYLKKEVGETKTY